MNTFIIWLAQGFGLGRIPVAPGTFGSLGGLLWFLLLVQLRSPVPYCVGLFLGLALSVWACGAAERILHLKDPGCIVLDELAVIPIIYTPWLFSLQHVQKAWPAPEDFFTQNRWVMTLILLVLFRVFDIAKPWPIRQSQSLPGGWGVTMDDCLAALFVALLSLLVLV